MNLLAALVNQCFGPQGAGLTEIKGALCLSRLLHVCFHYKNCWCNCNRCKQCRPLLGCSYRSSLIWVHPVLENNRMCQKSHKSFQRTTGQTTTDGLGVTSTSNSPLTIQRGHFMKKTGNSVYLLNQVVRRPICVIWDNKRVVQHVHKHWFARTFFVDLESILANPCNFMIIYCPVGQDWRWPHALFAKLLGT